MQQEREVVKARYMVLVSSNQPVEFANADVFAFVPKGCQVHHWALRGEVRAEPGEPTLRADHAAPADLCARVASRGSVSMLGYTVVVILI